MDDEGTVKFINIDNEERLVKLYSITMELHARETSGNCVISKLVNKSWVELCEEGIRLFQELKGKNNEKT